MFILYIYYTHATIIYNKIKAFGTNLVVYLQNTFVFLAYKLNKIKQHEQRRIKQND